MRSSDGTFAGSLGCWLRCACICLLVLSGRSYGQTAPNPAGTDVPLPAATPLAAPDAGISAKQRREAEDAYLKGAQALEKKDLQAAETAFARAVRLNSANRDYDIALAVTRQHRLLDLVERAARANALGRTDEADRLLIEARAIDPENAVVRQHFNADGGVAAAPVASKTLAEERADDAATLAAGVALTPAAGQRDFHLRASAPELLQQVCAAFGIRAVAADSSSMAGPVLRFEVEGASFAQALRAVEALTGTFSVPVQPTELLYAKDTPENRVQYQPLLEETLYLRGVSQSDLTEYANMARSVFNLRVVNAVNTAGALVLRGDEESVRHANATFAELIDQGNDVLIDLNLYEVDRSHINNLGVQLPSAAGAFPIASTAESLINANQSTIAEAVANNLITLTGNPYTDALTELEFLIGAGIISSSQFSNLLGVFGHYGGLPLAGTYLASTTAVNASLTSSDVRLLDIVQLRAGDRQDAQFRAGTRYPIETGVYSSNVTSALSSAVAGLTINGTSVASLLSQYAGATSTTVPQIQFEDLGITLKATPTVLRTGDVTLKLDMKIEALGSGSINTLPILNSRQLTSAVTVPAGQTALLGSLVSTSEFRAITGLPFLSEIPGFESTNKDTEKDSTELMITLTPHVVRTKRLHIASQRLLVSDTRGAAAGAQ